jgi:enoyl-CoA hydratase
MLEGRPFSAKEALDVGLVHRLVPGEDLLDEAHTTAERMAHRSPYAVSAVKRAVYFNAHRALSAALDYELACFIGTGRNPRKHLTAEAFRDDLDRLGDTPFVHDIDPWLAGTKGEFGAQTVAERRLPRRNRK